MQDAEFISVVISTRDRAGMAARCVASVLRNQCSSFDLVVVDQSADGSTEAALREFQADPRLCYVRSETKGLSAGRNLGIGRARGDLIACTDDDCEAPPDWLSRMVAALRHGDRAAVVFGNMRPGAHDRAAGFVPGYLLDGASLARSLREEHCADGMSGCMGLKRSVWEQLGGFDEMLGAGSTFRAAEDMDFAIRALLAGFWVYATPEVQVTHYGFRSWEEGRTLIQGYLYGIGAMVAKHLKCGNWRILYFVTRLFHRWAFAGPVVDLGHRPSRRLRLRAFVRGGIAGLGTAVERRRLLFRTSRAS
jgi:glycosyltransferase involved in cell wall biosynthesis